MSVPPEMIHPTSKWTEPITDSRYMLTLYDLNRNPRPVQNPSRRLTVSMAALNSEFVCPICLGYIRKASLVMECLHRFCAECIQKCLRFGRKECPSCRIHIPSRRSLRQDEEFDWILRHILGDVRALEEEDARQAELAKTRNLQISDARKQGMLYQQEAMQQNKASATPNKRGKYSHFGRAFENAFRDDEPPDTTKVVLHPETQLDIKPTELVEFLLLRHPEETHLPSLRKEFLTMNRNASVRILKIFLSRKLLHDDWDEIMILGKYEDEWVELEDSLSLKSLQQNLRPWDGNDTSKVVWKLWYHRFQSIQNDTT